MSCVGPNPSLALHLWMWAITSEAVDFTQPLFTLCYQSQFRNEIDKDDPISQTFM